MLLLLILFVCYTHAEISLNVDNFRVLGYEYNEKILAYTGIPYAHPPVDLLRFEPPRSKAYFDNEIINDRTKESVVCAQADSWSGKYVINGEEDCLYLNIYTPKNPKFENLPIMIYIHGGGFAWGTGTMFKPDYLLQEQNVILVTFNYRLGPLGFLTAGRKGGKIYANNGLKDQAMAIKWVHDYIAQFGGDSKRITLFGNSAGAASSHLQLFSTKNKGLIHSVIVQSGSAFCPWAVQRFEDLSTLSAQYAQLLDCPFLPIEEMLYCLKQKSTSELLNIITKFTIFVVDPILIFGPSVEPKHKGAILLDLPANLIKNGNFSDVPILQGVVPSEGAMRSAVFAANPKTLKKFDKYFDELYPFVSKQMHYTTTQVRKIRRHYFGKDLIDENNINNLTDLLSYAYFRCNMNTPTMHHKYANSSIYSYLLNYKGALTFSKYFANNETVDLGVCHMDELLYLFPLEFFFENNVLTPKKLSADDEKMSVFMTKLWVYFASHGHLHDFEDLNSNRVNWQPVQSTNSEYFIIDQFSMYSMGENLFEKSDTFWNDLEKYDRSGKRMTRDEL